MDVENLQGKLFELEYFTNQMIEIISIAAPLKNKQTKNLVFMVPYMLFCVSSLAKECSVNFVVYQNNSFSPTIK